MDALRKSSSPTKSPKKRNPQSENHATKIDPKLGAPRKTAGVRNLPKLEKGREDARRMEKGGKKKEKTRRDSGR